jgi:hypothetical protein
MVEQGGFIIGETELRLLKRRFILVQFMSFVQLLSPIGVMAVAVWLIVSGDDYSFLREPVFPGVVVLVIVVELVIYLLIFRPQRILLHKDIVEQKGVVVTGAVTEKSVRNRKYCLTIADENFAVSFAMFTTAEVGQQAELKLAEHSRYVFSCRPMSTGM